MSKLSKILGFLSTKKAQKANIPIPQVPAAPAPSARTDTGADVTVGTDAVKNQRVSGRTGATKKTVDVLAGLGAGNGLSI